MCKGINKKDGLPCRREYWLNSNGYCSDHSDQYYENLRINKNLYKLDFNPSNTNHIIPYSDIRKNLKNKGKVTDFIKSNNNNFPDASDIINFINENEDENELIDLTNLIKDENVLIDLTDLINDENNDENELVNLTNFNRDELFESNDNIDKNDIMNIINKIEIQCKKLSSLFKEGNAKKRKREHEEFYSNKK